MGERVLIHSFNKYFEGTHILGFEMGAREGLRTGCGHSTCPQGTSILILFQYSWGKHSLPASSRRKISSISFYREKGPLFGDHIVDSLCATIKDLRALIEAQIWHLAKISRGC